MIIGYAICDLDANHQDIRQSLKRLPSNAIEIQKEGRLWSNDALRKAVKGYGFVSVHAPTRYTDLSAVDERMLQRGRERTIESMEIASIINADVLVLHPVHYEGWLEPKDRNHKRNIFVESFQNFIVPHYLDSFHSYKIAIENIEYPKYPATLEETLELHATLSAIHPVQMVIDISHIWNSRRMLAENGHLTDKVLGYPWTPEILYDYVEKFVRHNNEKIAMYHVANFGEDPIRTHDPISQEDIHPELRKIIPVIKDKPIILEIYRQEPEVLDNSKRTVEEIADEQR